jgi:hypothetical protein
MRTLSALAFNSAAERCIAYSIATNIAAITESEAADEYKLLAPYGDTPYWIEDGKGGFKCLTQRFTPPQAAKIVAAFNAYREKQGKNFIGMPIYRGHPDADPVRWPDERRYGHVLDVQQWSDGLYVKLAWNDLGLDNKKNHYLPYPSVAWLYDMAVAARTGIIEPDEIQSVGLTNQPRMKNVPVWTNASGPQIVQPGGTKTTTQQEADMNSTINTAKGRANLFKKRIEELTKPKTEGGQGLTMDQAIFELRTSENHDDVALLAAMGDAPSAVRKEKLSQQKHNEFLTKLADENARATTPSPEVAAAMRVATNARSAAFNARMDILMAKGLTIDQAVDHMRANPTDAALLRSMGGV